MGYQVHRQEVHVLPHVVLLPQGVADKDGPVEDLGEVVHGDKINSNFQVYPKEKNAHILKWFTYAYNLLTLIFTDKRQTGQFSR